MSIQISGSVVIDNSRNIIVGSSATITTQKAHMRPAAICVGQVTTTERNALTGVQAGTLIYNTTNTRVEVWDGSTWTGGFSPS